MSPDEALAGIASRQHALFTTRQADAAGMTPKMLRGRVERGVVALTEPGVYRYCGAPVSWQQRVLAACLAEDGWASHRTAAALWRLDGCRMGIVEVVTHRWRRRPNRSFRLHETALLDPEDRAEVEGIPVTSPARTIVDLAAVAPRERVEAALDTHGVDLDAVWDCVERLGTRGRPWVAVVRRLVAARLGREGVPPNTFEKRLAKLLVQHGLPRPAAQVPIDRSDGTFLARVDWCYLDERVVLECDSYEHHGQWVRRKRDLRRDRELAALGYRVLRVSWEDVTVYADQTAADVGAVLALVSA
jgi:very-short-patch-repair endonuclease